MLGHRHLYIVEEVVHKEPHVSPQLTDSLQLIQSASVLHEHCPAMLQSDLCASQQQQELEDGIVSIWEDSEDTKMRPKISK